MSSACDQNCFALRERIRGISHQTPGIPDGGFGGAARHGIANRHVALRVNRDAGHKAPQSVRGVIKRLLLHRNRVDVAGRIELIPANRRRAGAILVVVDGMGDPQ
jgi:hypothetical protein